MPGPLDHERILASGYLTTPEVVDLDRRPASAPDRLLEAEDVAAMLGMTTDWIYREVRAKRLPHIRLGRYVRFRKESIDAWLDKREHGGRSRPTESRG